MELSSVLGISKEVENPIFPKDKEHLRWSKLIELSDSKEVFNKFIEKDGVFDFLKKLHGDRETIFSKYMKNAVFQVPNANVLQKVMDEIEAVFKLEEMKSKDSMGDLYEYLLSKLSTSGTNGQFRTPKHIIDMMVKLTKPTPQDNIIDPACGTAGFLASSIEYLKNNFKEMEVKKELSDHFHNNMFFGNDTDETMLGISAMNMILHGVDNPNLNRVDSLSDGYTEEEKYSLALANPPFKGSLDYDQTSNSLLNIAKTKKTELLFITLILRLLKTGGRAAVIVPDGVLFGSSNAHKEIRKELIENHKLQAVISMPSGVFKPYAGVSTGILVFTKTGVGGTDKVWFYDMTADGLSLDDKRQLVDENDIPDIVERFNNLEKEEGRKKTEKSFFVSKDDIVNNDYDLSINRYKEIEYEEVEYEAPEIILEQIEVLEKEIQVGIAEIKAMIRG